MATESITGDIEAQAALIEQPNAVPATGIRTIGLGILLGIVGTLLVYPHEIALGFTIYTVLLIGALFFHARIEKVNPVRRNVVILVPLTLFFTAMIAIRSDFFLGFMNLCMGVLAALLLVYFFSSGNLLKQDFLDYAFKTILTTFSVWVHPFEEGYRAQKWIAHRPKGWKAGFVPVVRGLIITIPIMLVFIVLFSSADPVFANLIDSVIKLLTLHDFEQFGGYAITAVVLGWTAVGGLGFALLERKSKRDQMYMPPIAHEAISKIALGITETIIVLGGVVAVFATFVALQFRYLLGGAGNLSTFNYAQYLRRGFAELVIAAVLTLGLVYGLNLITTRQTARQHNIFRILATILILLASVILFSAFQRLWLYEEAYGFTPQRLIVYIFILWLGGLFAGFTLSLYWKPQTLNVFGLFCFIALFGFAITLDLINPDAFVAQQMVARGDIDPLHLSSLSEEAIPIMVSLLNSPDPGVRSIMAETLSSKHSWLLNYSRDFRDFSLGQYNAIRALESVKDKLTAQYRSSGQEWTVEDFKDLKKGMTYRAVIRRYGRPFYYDADYDTFSPLRGNITPQAQEQILVQYRLKSDQGQILDQYMFIYLDSSDGLAHACIGENQQTCKPLVPQN
jgi:hypothetical protein